MPLCCSALGKARIDSAIDRSPGPRAHPIQKSPIPSLPCVSSGLGNWLLSLSATGQREYHMGTSSKAGAPNHSQHWYTTPMAFIASSLKYMHTGVTGVGLGASPFPIPCRPIQTNFEGTVSDEKMGAAADASLLVIGHQRTLITVLGPFSGGGTPSTSGPQLQLPNSHRGWWGVWKMAAFPSHPSQNPCSSR
jgi:hypothetical protein